VYDLGGGKVLRRYRDAARVADREAEVMIHARAHGVPVPEVFEVTGTDLVMENVQGPTMLQALARQPWTLGRHARLLAQLHDLVHSVPALTWQPAPFGPGDRLVHLDLHPDNVILTSAGPRLIDWERASRGPAQADLALTWVLLVSSQIPGPAAQRLVGQAGQRLFARRFLAGVPRLEPDWLAAMARNRLDHPVLTESEVVGLRRLLDSRGWAQAPPMW
jgi:aminoglycoside phosphotransferase (APT) family kinase protein